MNDGHAKDKLISQVLPNFLMFRDALKNTYWGLRKYKYVDKAEPIQFIKPFFFI